MGPIDKSLPQPAPQGKSVKKEPVRVPELERKLLMIFMKQLFPSKL